MAAGPASIPELRPSRCGGHLQGSTAWPIAKAGDLEAEARVAEAVVGRKAGRAEVVAADSGVLEVAVVAVAGPVGRVVAAVKAVAVKAVAVKAVAVVRRAAAEVAAAVRVVRVVAVVKGVVVAVVAPVDRAVVAAVARAAVARAAAGRAVVAGSEAVKVAAGVAGAEARVAPVEAEAVASARISRASTNTDAPVRKERGRPVAQTSRF